MATNLIPLATDARRYGELISAIQQLRSARDAITNIRSMMLEMRDTTPEPDDYSQVEAYFGAPAGKGQALFTLVNATFTAMDVNGLKNLIDRVL